MTEAPRPFSPRPWSRTPDQNAIFGADGKPVSFVQNEGWIMFVDGLHDELVGALIEARAQLLLKGKDVSPRVLARINKAIERAGVQQ